MAENGLYKGEDMLLYLKRMDSKLDQHGRSVETLKRETGMYLESTAHNTSEIARSMKDLSTSLTTFANDNKELVTIIAGKKQVPSSVFFLVVVTLCVGFGLILVAVTGVEPHFKDGNFWMGRSAVNGNDQ